MKLKNILSDATYDKYIKPIQINLLQSAGRRIYAQEGEDIIIERMLGSKKSGFYIDIGAHHPYRFSNTYYFYKKGWSGINIEPNPELFKYFKQSRKRDINLNIGLSSKPQELKYYYFDEPAMNTFSSTAIDHIRASGHRLLHTAMIPTTTLTLALQPYTLPAEIDFMTIDAEGLDYDIIQSNDWSRINPKLILIETKAESLRELLESEVTQYLATKHYIPVSKLNNTSIYKKTH